MCLTDEDRKERARFAREQIAVTLAHYRETGSEFDLIRFQAAVARAMRLGSFVDTSPLPPPSHVVAADAACDGAQFARAVSLSHLDAAGITDPGQVS